jgi:protein-tyrosine-phosphatase
MSKARVLFVCAGNTCRSVLAEYLARKYFTGSLEAASVGLRPQSAVDAENAIFTLSQRGIDASSHKPRGIESADLGNFDYIVAMHSDIARELRARPNFPIKNLKQWKITDPCGHNLDNLVEYEKCAQTILRELKKFVKTVPPSNV